MNRFAARLLAAVLACIGGIAGAQDILMVRSGQSFAEAMLTLQDVIKTRGYTLSRVQRVDIGLTESGYKTDKYRVVFFGKPEEIRSLSQRYPELIPYLPLKIAIFAEGQETLLVASNPTQLRPAYPHDDLAEVFDRWATDIQAMLDDVASVE